MFANLSAAARGAARFAPALGLGVAAATMCTMDSAKADSTKETLGDILARVKGIEADLGVGASSAAAGFSAADNFPNVPANSDGSKSYVGKYLTPELYAKLSSRSTKNGWTLDQAIQCAIDYPVLDGHHLSWGFFAGDEESYDVFEEFLKPMIKDYHGFDMDKDVHVPDTNPDHVTVPNPDPEGKYIQSTRIRAGRQIRGLTMPPQCTRAERRKVESLLKGAFASFTGDLKGTYEPRSEMTADRHKELVVTKHFLFEDPDKWTMIGNFARDWPDARGIFISDNEKALVWVNEEDHMRCISMQKGADVKAVFSRWADIVNQVEAYLITQGYSYAIHPVLGAVTSCPSNLGTGMRASVHVKLPLLGRKAGFKKFCADQGVQVRGRGGEKDHSFTGVFDLSNLSRLGKGEAQLVDDMLACVAKCIELEKRLEAGESIEL